MLHFDVSFETQYGTTCQRIPNTGTALHITNNCLLHLMVRFTRAREARFVAARTPRAARACAICIATGRHCAIIGWFTRQAGGNLWPWQALHWKGATRARRKVCVYNIAHFIEKDYRQFINTCAGPDCARACQKYKTFYGAHKVRRYMYGHAVRTAALWHEDMGESFDGTGGDCHICIRARCVYVMCLTKWHYYRRTVFRGARNGFIVSRRLFALNSVTVRATNLAVAVVVQRYPINDAIMHTPPPSQRGPSSDWVY